MSRWSKSSALFVCSECSRQPDASFFHCSSCMQDYDWLGSPTTRPPAATNLMNPFFCRSANLPRRDWKTGTDHVCAHIFRRHGGRLQGLVQEALQPSGWLGSPTTRPPAATKLYQGSSPGEVGRGRPGAPDTVDTVHCELRS
jgi:hypothetical protein